MTKYLFRSDSESEMTQLFTAVSDGPFTLQSDEIIDGRFFSKEELAMREKLRKEFPSQHETQIAYEIFKDKFPELALTLLHEGDLRITDRTIEEALITYVDYRIFKEQIVSLEERFAYFAEVYISKNKLWRKALDRNKIVEQNIFARLDLEPCQLKEAMEAERSIRLNEAIRRSV